jgi:hypothetical protein
MAKVLVTEEQFQMLMKRITEEAAGYDDFDVMFQHGGTSMGMLVDTLTDLSQVFKGIVQMTKSENIEYIDFKENLEVAIDLISEITNMMKTVFRDFTERKTIRKGEILHRKLESFQEKLRIMINMGEELLSKENLIDRLIDLTENLGGYIVDYAMELKNADKTLRGRLDKFRPRPKTDLN